mmetsp:Transcript_34052/g.93940  ORF Transcript_34052/g.93940 Transcript_34052/m.93940 type:complete len:337 (+) Transcript_34052:71-1081(+)|eukprot:CAMPEP_0117493862 /NCGR_PEP_ID=MMETSP0784-20121206/19314_1 /TAXON_ID=39447 /ORGANISM="" /LENGTH=336 /DNA_ID=CAMNT_0005288723 /DNA_START=40 /DNA_END=1050 /DNA_ORIENTATION=+
MVSDESSVSGSSSDASDSDEGGHERVLHTFDLNGIAQYILEHEVRRVVVMTGAGISTSAGIPDFRSEGTGLYENLSRFDLPSPESIFDLEYFMERPAAFYELCREIWPGNYEPTPCHYFIRLLHEKGILLRCYTQNIDSLERQAGLPAEKIVAAHGNFDSAHVVDDLRVDDSVEVEASELKAVLDQGDESSLEDLREKWGGLVKPRIVFFGEGLPKRFIEMGKNDLEECDLLIVMGTSLVVHPFADLVGMASPMAPRLLVNREAAGKCEKLQGGFRFHLRGEGRNWRDVWHRGECDAAATKLAKKLGWASDLHDLVQSKGAAIVPKAPWAFEKASK